MQEVVNFSFKTDYPYYEKFRCETELFIKIS